MAVNLKPQEKTIKRENLDKKEIGLDVNSTVGFDVCAICNLVMVQGRIGGAKVSEKDEEPANQVS